jgi:hypothetical protein
VGGGSRADSSSYHSLSLQQLQLQLLRCYAGHAGRCLLLLLLADAQLLNWPAEGKTFPPIDMTRRRLTFLSSAPRFYLSPVLIMKIRRQEHQFD